VVCDIPLGPLADEAPEYERPYVSPEDYKAWANVPALGEVPSCDDIAGDLTQLMACPDLASRRWIWEQYDSQVGADTMQKSGGDAAVVRVHGTHKALAISTDCSPRYCYADPYEGGKQAVAETWRNICAVGGTPLAITNCLNFANPQRPEIMAQIVGCLNGMGDACRALDYPIVSGNVSLYNESKATGGGSAILPTPAIGGVGLLADHAKMATIAFKEEGQHVLLLCHSWGHLGQSLWLREIHGREAGNPPPVDLAAERAAGELVRKLIADGTLSAVHDCSDGGVAVAMAEMALAGNIGFSCAIPADLDDLAGFWFGEDQGRYVVTTLDPETVIQQAAAAGVNVVALGVTGGDACRFHFTGYRPQQVVKLDDLRAANEAFFRDWMEG